MTRSIIPYRYKLSHCMAGSKIAMGTTIKIKLSLVRLEKNLDNECVHKP